MWNETRLINFDVEIYPKLNLFVFLAYVTLCNYSYTVLRKSFFLFWYFLFFCFLVFVEILFIVFTCNNFYIFIFYFFCCRCFPKMEIKITSNLSTCSLVKLCRATRMSICHKCPDILNLPPKICEFSVCVCVCLYERWKKWIVRENKQWQILKIKRENSGKTFVIPRVTCVSTLLIEWMCVC